MCTVIVEFLPQCGISRWRTCWPRDDHVKWHPCTNRTTKKKGPILLNPQIISENALGRVSLEISLVDQWLKLPACTAGAGVQSLLSNLRPGILHGVAKIKSQHTQKTTYLRLLLSVQQSRLCTCTAGSTASIPGWGTKIPHATWCVQCGSENPLPTDAKEISGLTEMFLNWIEQIVVQQSKVLKLV